MKQAIILAGAALAFVAAPAAAKPDHAKHGGHGKHSQAFGYGVGGCPPGLAKKRNGCLPPGQAKKLNRGQRYLSSYGYRNYGYNQIPYDLRRQYDFDRGDRYYYNDGYLYQVDPRTMIVEQVIRALLR